MLQIRPVRANDLDRYVELAQAAEGLTTLPSNRRTLGRRIAHSEHSFTVDADAPGGELYVLVLEDTESGAILGTSSIISKVGGFQPFYSYVLHIERFECKRLGVSKAVRELHLREDHNGPSEVATLALHPQARGGGLGRMLSLSRFLLMAFRPQAFEDRVIAEVRGVTDERGESPFWNAVGRHFFGLDFPSADALSLVEKTFIGDLMPDHPLYVDLLPTAAQEVIGRAHPHAQPARRLLEAEGFRFDNHVDIFDAGPELACPRDEIRVVRESKRLTVSEISDAALAPADWLVSNERWRFRAVLVGAKPDGDGVTIDRATAAALDVATGDAVRCVRLKPSAVGPAEQRDVFAQAATTVTTTPLEKAPPATESDMGVGL